MKQIRTRIVVLSSSLMLVTGTLVHAYAPKAEVTAPEATTRDPHMVMTGLRPLQPGDQVRADAIIADAKKVGEHYRDYRVAEAAGYRIFLPDQHQDVYHFIREAGDLDAKGHFDPSDLPALLYTKTDGPKLGYKLVGILYTARYGATQEELNARVPLSIAQWHEHINLMCSCPARSA